MEVPDELGDLDQATAAMLRGLCLRHVRVNIDLTTQQKFDHGVRRAELAKALASPLDLVLLRSPGEVRPEEVPRIGDGLGRARPELARVVVMEALRSSVIGRTATASAKVRGFRQVIESACGSTCLVSGTDQFFADINRNWPQPSGIDGVGWSICPQVHAADDVCSWRTSGVNGIPL